MQEPQEPQIRSLGQEDLLEEGMVTHCSILAWRIPWTEEPGELQSIGSQRVRHMTEVTKHSTARTMYWGFPGGSDSIESARNAGDLDSIPRLRRFPGEGNGYLLHYFFLENSMDRRSGGL